MSLSDILAPYPPDFSRSFLATASAIGDHMPAIGRVPRFYREREVDYDDEVVKKYLSQVGEAESAYQDYAVTNKRAGQSRAAISRYDRCGDPPSNRVANLYKIAGSWLDKEFGPYVCGSEVQTYEQALEWLRPDTSPGMPWTQKYPTKFDYHESEDGVFFFEYYRRLATDDYVKSLCSVSEKVELRPREKVESGAVRTTISMDVNHVTAQHLLCHDHDQKLIASNKLHSIKLGMDMFNGGFDTLYSFLNAFGADGAAIELDGKTFDGRTKLYHFAEICKFRQRMLCNRDRTEANCKRLRNLYHELCYAPFVDVDGNVFGRECGNPSGQKCTTSDNSYKNFMDVAVLYMLATGNYDYATFKAFVRLCAVGDDLIVVVHRGIQHLLNVDSIKRDSDLIEMVYHFVSDGFQDLSQCTFLGHRFVRAFIPHLRQSMWLPCIDGHKMRCSLLKHNELGTVHNTIVRACSLRAETFPDEEQREWFMNFIRWLQQRYPATDPKYSDVWKNFKTDYELWELYSGFGMQERVTSVSA